jgi:replicative DNA helicase
MSDALPGAALAAPWVGSVRNDQLVAPVVVPPALPAQTTPSPGRSPGGPAHAVGVPSSAPDTVREGIVSAKPRTSRDVLAGIIHRRNAIPGVDQRLATSFDPLDDVLGGGFAPQDLVLLGGKPGVGKTIALVQWARSFAVAGHRVVFASYELSEANLLGRLLTSEIGTRSRHLPEEDRRSVTRVIRDSVRSGSVSEDPVVRSVIRQAYDSIDDYADRLLLHRVSGYHTGPRELAELAADWAGPGGVLVVDYLQKVPVKGASDDSDRVLTVAESLKETAMTHDVCVVAAAAVSADGLGHRRLRLEHLRGSALLAHEVDLAIAMNEKQTALSKTHLAYDPHLFESARNQVVFSIEKNREGPANVHLEFSKQFEDYRFDPNGGYVMQRLTDDIFDD